MTAFKTSDFNIATCSCYYSNWKEIKDINDESWKFDEIENGKKSIRKLFHKKMTIFHCCWSCFDKSIMMNPFILDENSPAGHCIMRKFMSVGSTNDEVCNACIWFFVENFKKEFNFFNTSI